MKLRAIRDNILCTDADFGDQVTQSGLIIKSNVNLSQGITPRWFKVFSVGSDITGVEPGKWVLVEYGRWSEAIEVDNDDGSKLKIWKVDPNCCLAIADEKPEQLYYNSDVVVADKKTL